MFAASFVTLFVACVIVNVPAPVSSSPVVVVKAALEAETPPVLG
jgi:hypothetical protein